MHVERIAEGPIVLEQDPEADVVLLLDSGGDCLGCSGVVVDVLASVVVGRSVAARVSGPAHLDPGVRPVRRSSRSCGRRSLEAEEHQESRHRGCPRSKTRRHSGVRNRVHEAPLSRATDPFRAIKHDASWRVNRLLSTSQPAASGSQSSRAGSRRTRRFRARGSAARPGSAGWRAPRPRRPASRTPVRSPRRGSSGPPPPSPGP